MYSACADCLMSQNKQYCITHHKSSFTLPRLLYQTGHITPTPSASVNQLCPLCVPSRSTTITSIVLGQISYATGYPLASAFSVKWVLNWHLLLSASCLRPIEQLHPSQDMALPVMLGRTCCRCDIQISLLLALTVGSCYLYKMNSTTTQDVRKCTVIWQLCTS